MHLRTAPVLLVFTLPRVTVVIYNPTLRCHPEEDTFPFESGSHQGFFLVSFQGVSEMPCLVTSGLLIRDFADHKRQPISPAESLHCLYSNSALGVWLWRGLCL